MNENAEIRWKQVETHGNKCSSCGTRMKIDELLLHICSRYRVGQTHICEQCFIKAVKDYEEG